MGPLLPIHIDIETSMGEDNDFSIHDNCGLQKVATELALEIKVLIFLCLLNMFIESGVILEVLFSSFRNYKSNFLMLWIAGCLEINDTPFSSIRILVHLRVKIKDTVFIYLWNPSQNGPVLPDILVLSFILEEILILMPKEKWLIVPDNILSVYSRHESLECFYPLQEKTFIWKKF